ncbi:hypothetical protein AVEN_215258-1 [Araneus ventricosus]|uniref:Uncharacterized protein n=1 Tax=Araneus ventricosus TaxID=182803 RepID=A0A4Y2RH04_ARAVE|nr:hypothetical protein AVEN_215258-1 [Araneus ventricosus]
MRFVMLLFLKLGCFGVVNLYCIQAVLFISSGGSFSSTDEDSSVVNPLHIFDSMFDCENDLFLYVNAPTRSSLPDVLFFYRPGRPCFPKGCKAYRESTGRKIPAQMLK